MEKVLMNWSGGKDSSLCLHQLLQSDKYEVVGLLTSVNEAYNRVSMHGIRVELIRKQANHLGLPVHFLQLPKNVSMETYNRLMSEALEPFTKRGISCCAFGDIFLDNLRAHREEKLAKANLTGIFPLWKQSTEALARQFIAEGFKAVLTSVDASKVDSSFVGRSYNEQLLAELPAGVDPCGEHGEFHSFVYDGPMFKLPINFRKGDIVERTYQSSLDTASDEHDTPSQSSHSFWFIDLKSQEL